VFLVKNQKCFHLPTFLMLSKKNINVKYYLLAKSITIVHKIYIMNNNVNGAANAAKEFMDFLKKFGVIGLAIGTVVGGAVKTYVDVLVNSLVNPIVNLVLDFVNFKAGGALALPTVNGKTESLLIGDVISGTISFLVLMLLVYVTVNVLISKFMTDADKGAAGI
jgi:large conductance mechanosensitive channel